MYGYFLDTDGKTCTKCESPCEHCVTSKSQCLVCGYGADKRISPPTCACMDDYDDAISECVTCSHPCKYCFSTANTDCLGCVHNFTYNESNNHCEPCKLGCKVCELDVPTSNGICSECNEEYFLRGTDCLPCVYPCITCLEVDYCYTCGFDEIESRRNIPPSCSCLHKYSDNGSRCVLCTDPCKTCVDEADD